MARLNRLCNVLEHLTIALIEQHIPDDCRENSVLDSMPIITCSGKRQGKVAPDITEKGYCSTKAFIIMDLSYILLAGAGKVNCPGRKVLYGRVLLQMI
jgi:hypothetical protein